MQMGMGRAGPGTTDPAIGHKQALSYEQGSMVHLVREGFKGPGLLHVGIHRWARRRGQVTSKVGSFWAPEHRGSSHPHSGGTVCLLPWHISYAPGDAGYCSGGLSEGVSEGE